MWNGRFMWRVIVWMHCERTAKCKTIKCEARCRNRCSHNFNSFFSYSRTNYTHTHPIDLFTIFPHTSSSSLFHSFFNRSVIIGSTTTTDIATDNNNGHNTKIIINFQPEKKNESRRRSSVRVVNCLLCDAPYSTIFFACVFFSPFQLENKQKGLRLRASCIATRWPRQRQDTRGKKSTK